MSPCTPHPCSYPCFFPCIALFADAFTKKEGILCRCCITYLQVLIKAELSLLTSQVRQISYDKVRHGFCCLACCAVDMAAVVIARLQTACWILALLSDIMFQPHSHWIYCSPLHLVPTRNTEACLGCSCFFATLQAVTLLSCKGPNAHHAGFESYTAFQVGVCVAASAL